MVSWYSAGVELSPQDDFMRDPYQVLGVKRTADAEEIKAAWRALAKSVHPDRNSQSADAAARFAEAGQAYQLLKDPDKRFRYDMERRKAEETKTKKTTKGRKQHASANTNTRKRAERPGPDVSEATKKPPGAVFQFLKKVATPPEKKAPDLYAELPLTIEALFRRENQQVKLPDGRKVKVSLPEEVTDGLKIRIPAQGFNLPDMQRGDVVATVRIMPHKLFRTKGTDLYVNLAVDIENAILGCETVVDAPEGPVTVKVPEWSGSDYKVKLPARGLPKQGGGRGDLYAEVRVMLWDRPDEKVKDLMRSLREGLFL
jgi:DnaJ-class molecular chaperone